MEMGQGIYTSLAMSVVEELEMNLDQVEDIKTIFHPAFKNPLVSYMTSNKLQLQMTGGSTSEEPAAAAADASMSRPARAEAAGEEPELTHEQAQAQKARARKELLALRDQIDTQKETLDFL